MRHQPGRREDVAVDFGDALSQLAADVDAPSCHRLAPVYLHASHRPGTGTKGGLKSEGRNGSKPRSEFSTLNVRVCLPCNILIPETV